MDLAYSMVESNMELQYSATRLIPQLNMHFLSVKYLLVQLQARSEKNRK